MNVARIGISATSSIARIRPVRCVPSSRLALDLFASRTFLVRGLSSSSAHRNLQQDASTRTTPSPIKFNSNVPRVIYQGPLTKTFKYLKMFSLSSLVLSTALSPFIFILESSLPLSGRIFLAFTAISTTTLSTFLISTFTSPYVTAITANPASSPYSHTLTTTSLLLRPRHTSITSPSISLVPSERPLTTWKLRESVENGAEVGSEYGAAGAGQVEEGVLAVTEDSEGNTLGKWAVMGMDLQGRQECVPRGKVVRYFNIHPELLQEPIEVGAGSSAS